MSNLVREQRPPEPNDSRPVWELVIDDMRAKHEAGVAKYGTPLQAHNGRDALVDLYQELLDACAYVRQTIAERPARAPSVEALMDAQHRWCVRVEGEWALGHTVESHRHQAEYVHSVLAASEARS
jgi:hypothetical protein